MKKSLLVVGAALLSTALTVGCGANPTTAQPTEKPTDDFLIKEKTEISMWIKSDRNSEIYQTFVESFKEVEPNVTVKLSALEDVNNYNELQQKVLVGITAKNYPNLVQAYPGHVADYMHNDIAINIEDYISNENYGWSKEELEKFDLSSGRQFGVEGTYLVPFNKSTEVLYYNADKLVGLNLSAYNVEINEGRPLTHEYLSNLTWQELFGKLAPAIIECNEKQPELELIDTTNEHWSVLHYEDDANHFITTMKQFDVPYTSVDSTGKGTLLFNSPEAKQLRKQFAEYAAKHYIVTRWSAEGQNGYSATHLTNGSALFAVNSTNGASYFYDSKNPINIGIGHVPYNVTNKPYVVEQGTGLAMLDRGHANENLASWLFYKHMTSYENSLSYALSSGYLPNRSDIYEDPAYIRANDAESIGQNSAQKITAQVKSYAKLLKNDFFTEAPFVGSSAARNAVSRLNSALFDAAKKGKLTDELIDAKFLEAYNNAING